MISFRCLRTLRTGTYLVKWGVVDVVVAAGLTAGALIFLAGLRYSAPPVLVGAAAVVCTTTVAWRRLAPAAAALVAVAAVVAYQRLSHDSQGVAVAFAWLLAFYTLGHAEASRPRWSWLAISLGCALAAAVPTSGCAMRRVR